MALKDLAGKARRFIATNPEKARRGIDRVAKLADEKTGGKYRDTIKRASEQAGRLTRKPRRGGGQPGGAG